MIYKTICLLVNFGSVLGLYSPHAEEIAATYKVGKYSKDIIEDALLDTPGLVRKYGYPLSIHRIATKDGYILEMHRINHLPSSNHSYGQLKLNKKPVVFIMHGLLCSSADWILTGPEKGLGYILADAGFDVWMGNARGNYYSRRHKTLDPNKHQFWEFSWHEIGHYDLAAMIDAVLAKTRRSQLHYVGHSQGTTAFFVLTSTRPEYNSKIKSMHALAPVAFAKNARSPFVKLLTTFGNSLEAFADVIGKHEVLPNTLFLTIVGGAFCKDSSVFQPICSNIVFFISGFNVDQLNATTLPVVAGHTPAGSSSRQIVHYVQGKMSGRFRQYDHGSFGNLWRYGSTTPPEYNLKTITVPVFLHYSDNDLLADQRDVEKLYSLLGNPKGKFLFKKLSHVDFLWAIDVKKLVYDRIINLIRSLDVKH